jgi:hypothetical protein
VAEYSFSDVLRFTKATRSQLIHWTDKKVITAAIEETDGRGHHRRFSFRNLFEVAIAAELVAWKIQIDSIRTIVASVSLNLMSDEEADRVKKLAPSFNGHDAYGSILYVETPTGISTYHESESIADVLRKRNRKLKQLGVAIPPRRAALSIPIGAILRDLERQTGDHI